MNDNVLIFPNSEGAKSPLARFIRIDGAHRKLADLHASGQLRAKRVVVDASRVMHQKELLDSLRADGVEIALDTEAAELAAPGKLGTHCWKAPWAAGGKLIGPAHFKVNAEFDIIGQIARFAVENEIDTVLAPTHFLGDPNFDRWLEVDVRSCVSLRNALDREGGAHINIDYPVIVPHTLLNNDTFRGSVVEAVADLPIDYVWVRASGFGARNAGPLTMKRYVLAMAAIHNLGKPIIADYLGGLPAHAAMAFGAVSGIAHGIGEREQFDARAWHKSPSDHGSDKSFSRARRVLIPELERTVTVTELELLVAARGGGRLVACGVKECCPHGVRDMINDPRRHAAYHYAWNFQMLESIPALHREHHFLDQRLAQVSRHARSVKKLKFPKNESVRLGVNAEGFTKRLCEHSRKMDGMRAALEKLSEESDGGMPKAQPAPSRIGLTKKTKGERK